MLYAGHVHWNNYDLISGIFFWTPTHGHSSVGHPVKTCVHQLCADTRCILEDLPGVMEDWHKWWECESQGTPCYQPFWGCYIYIYSCNTHDSLGHFSKTGFSLQLCKKSKKWSSLILDPEICFQTHRYVVTVFIFIWHLSGSIRGVHRMCVMPYENENRYNVSVNLDTNIRIQNKLKSFFALFT